MRAGRMIVICLMMTALAGSVPAPNAETVARAQMESAVALEQAGRFSEAIEQLSQAIAAGALSNADTARAFYDRGVAQDGLGNLAAAYDDYSAALRLDPALAPALNNRANALRRLGRLAEAKRDYEAALDCPAGAHEYAYFGLGLLAQQQGDGGAARDHFQKAVAANPNFAPARTALGQMGNAGLTGLRPSQQDDPAASDVRAPAAPGFLVQLGAFQTEAMARGAWDKINADCGIALRGLNPVTVPVDIPGKGRLWRLRTVVASQAAAQALCSALTQRKLACVPVPR